MSTEASEPKPEPPAQVRNAAVITTIGVFLLGVIWEGGRIYGAFELAILFASCWLAYYHATYAYLLTPPLIDTRRSSLLIALALASLAVFHFYRIYETDTAIRNAQRACVATKDEELRQGYLCQEIKPLAGAMYSY